MTRSCWFPQVISGEYVLNTLEWVWNKYAKGMERTPSVTSILRYCIRWSGMEGSGTQLEDLFRISGLGSGSGCASLLGPDQSY